MSGWVQTETEFKSVVLTDVNKGTIQGVGLELRGPT